MIVLLLFGTAACYFGRRFWNDQPTGEDSARIGPAPVSGASEQVSPSDRWTVLDDHQLIRLLDASSP